MFKHISDYCPTQLRIGETLESGCDSQGQVYENIEIEYVTMGYKAGDDRIDVIIPEKPEDNIDDFWDRLPAFVPAYRKDDVFIVGNGGPGSRCLRLRGWGTLGLEESEK